MTKAWIGMVACVRRTISEKHKGVGQVSIHPMEDDDENRNTIGCVMSCVYSNPSRGIPSLELFLPVETKLDNEADVIEKLKEALPQAVQGVIAELRQKFGSALVIPPTGQKIPGLMRAPV